MSDKPDLKLVSVEAKTEAIPSDTPALEIGQWYWVKHVEEDDDGKQTITRWLGCVAHVGSNYVELRSVSGGTTRIHLDQFDECCTYEPAPEVHINAKIELHRENVRELLHEIQRLTIALGIAPKAELARESATATNALAIAHGTDDIEAHKNALIQAQKKTLPELFKRVEEEHRQLAVWMSAELLPMKAQLKQMEAATENIEQRIFTVELYAGLTEQLVELKTGKPASNDTKISLFQRRHYMDEECLVAYEAGGMEFANIAAFDRWLLRKENLRRILPLPRCLVAFRVRRNAKDRDWDGVHTLSDFIRMWERDQANELTFLYIRNGEQIYRLSTAIDFGEQLFPDRARSTLLGEGDLWIKRDSSSLEKVLSQREYDDIMSKYVEEQAEYEAQLREWKALPKKQRTWHNKPYNWNERRTYFEKYERCTPESVYYDDAMKRIAQAAMEHNRVAVVLQGLLDRSPSLHPHPPWRLWTPEGFAAGVELIYDDSKGLTVGPPPDFEAYRMALNASIKRGSMTIGQDDVWARAEAVKEAARMDRNWRTRSDWRPTHHRPYGNPGPGFIAPVVSISRDGQCTFEWKRERQGTKWVDNPDKPGWMKADDAPLQARFTCPISQLFNVSAYKAGDYRLFYSDPRTRADYLKWAPILLPAEDYVNGKYKSE